MRTRRFFSYHAWRGKTSTAPASSFRHSLSPHHMDVKMVRRAVALVATFALPTAIAVLAYYSQQAHLFLFLAACKSFALRWSGLGFWKPGNRCPTEIRGVWSGAYMPWDAGMGGGALRYNFDSMKNVHKAMLRCSNVKSLFLRTRLVGCTGFPDRYSLPFSAIGWDRYASAPELLSLDGYHFDEPGWQWWWWSSWTGRHGGPPGRSSSSWSCSCCDWDDWLSPRGWVSCITSWIPPILLNNNNKTNLELWLDAMDFSRIHTLHLNSTRPLSGKAAKLLSARVPSLRTLLVEGAQAQEFILNLPRASLTGLTWRNYQLGNDDDDYPPPSLEAVLEHQGERLASLNLRGDERDTRPVPPVPLELLQQLADLTPHLARLTLPLRRTATTTTRDKTVAEGRWPWEELQALGEALPQLVELTIHFELTSPVCQNGRHGGGGGYMYHDASKAHSGGEEEPRCGGSDRLARPILDADAAREMFEFLASKKVGRPLERATFKTGDWSRPRDGPDWLVNWIEGKRIWVTCVHHDDEAGYHGGGDQDGQGLPSSSSSSSSSSPELKSVVRCEGGDTLGPGWRLE